MKQNRLIINSTKPAQYLGGEVGVVKKDPSLERLSLALAFPEVYEIAMSHQGIKILYESMAERPEVTAERVFAPWLDLMGGMEREGLAPWSLETGRPLHQFDVIGFSLQYELTYTNLLAMLKMAGIPLRRQDRGLEHPLVIAGGPCMVNPEPVADFLDLAVIGDAEELIHELADLFIKAKEEGFSRKELYLKAMNLQGVYAPSLFEPVYENGRLAGVKALSPDHPKAERRILKDLNHVKPAVSPVVPTVKPVHDRFGLEIARGCTRGCRFCQAGYIYRPVREREPGLLFDCAMEGLMNTGQEELGVLSLSSGDYTFIDTLAERLMDSLEDDRVSLSLPSLRLDSLSPGLVNQIKRVRKTGFTLAPEAGSQRMRKVINKNLSEEQILGTAGQVYELGWNLIKLYFMLGLPTETDEDVKAIADLAVKVADQARKAGRGRGRKPVVHASLGLFVPKPHTPFQWAGQLNLEEAKDRLSMARSLLGDRRVKAKWNSPRQSVLEGVLSRGDRRLGRALENALEAGCRFDGWGEQLDYKAWMGALESAGLSVEEYLRPRELNEALPWDHIDIGVEKEFLLRERKKALELTRTGDCRNGSCSGCGVCDFKVIRPRLAEEPLEPAAQKTAREKGEEISLRFRLAKTGPARFLGHLETMSQLERAFRRAQVKLAYTKGFHPHAIIKTAGALPLGVESLVEVLEVRVRENRAPKAIEEAVNKTMPQGLELSQARFRRPGERLNEPDLVTYQVTTENPLDQAFIDRFNEAGSFDMIRTTPKGERWLDLKAAIRKMEITEDGLELTVAKAGGRPKPFEVLTRVFGLSPEEAVSARALKVAEQ